MPQASIRKSAVSAAFVVAALFGWAAPAQALLVVGRWDPAFGAPFNSPGSVLGWEGTAQWFLPDACVPGSGLVLNSAACSAGGMTMLGATVEFYNFSTDPAGNSPLATLSFGPASASVSRMNVAGSSVLGVDTSLTSALTPSSSFAGIGNYSFALQFSGANVRLFYALNGQVQSFGATNTGAKDDDESDCDDDDKCAPKPCAIGELAAPRCGVNDPRSPARVSFTSTVPEPQTPALMLAALGATALIARRRRHAQQPRTAV
jgi:hypothetical protein